MQVERQISLFGVLMGAAFALPEVYLMLTRPGVEPSGLFIFSGLLGGIGVLFGTLLAFVHPNYLVRNLGVVFWALVALAFAGAMLMGFMQSPGPVRRVFCAISGLLPVAAFCAVILGMTFASRPKSH